MVNRHPLSEQCPATSKRTGNRCELWVIGGGPCRWHGGAAPQVRAAREVRILTAEAALELPQTAADAADVLTSAMNDAHAMLQRLKVNARSGRTTTVADLTALGDWIDRAARIGKLVADAGLEERRVRLSERDGQILAGVIQRILSRMLAQVVESLAGDEVGAAVVRQRWDVAVPEIVPQELRAVAAASEVDRDHQ